jgi:hypothetical protein
MSRRRKSVAVALAVLLVCLGVLRGTSGWQVEADSLPDRISDETFWRLVNDFSEPNGYFFSDNFMSNENTFQRVIPELQRTLTQGGVYIGVGPEQNFTYLVALRPKVAFIIDIRRQNMIEHLLYKALIELSSDRADFLSRLFSRNRTSRVGPASTVKQLFAAYSGAAPNRKLFERNLQAVKQQLVDRHRFALSADDLKSLQYVFNEFYVHGPDMSYTFPGAGPGLLESFPAYADLMTETDGTGEHRGYLATEDNFRFLKRLETNNIVIPIVGDIAGPKAVRAVGRYLREHGATVTAFYTSNIEMYLRPDGAWSNFCGNVATLPLDRTSTFIRTVTRPRGDGQFGLDPELGNMATEVQDCGQSSGRP